MPDLSIVIPTIGRDAKLRRVLSGLARQDTDPSTFEVIVVRDAELPEALAIDEAVADRPFSARVLRSTTPGVSAKRNVGVADARASLVLFLDDDVVPRQDLLREHLAWHARHPEREAGVLGPVVWAPGVRVTPFMRWLERGIQFDYVHIAGEDAGWYRFYTANVSVKRELVEAVGGFDEVNLPFGYEDLDIAKRMHEEHGFHLLFNPEAVGEHLHVMTLESWRASAARNAAGERAFVAKHPEMPAYFHDLFRAATRRPPAHGRGRHLTWVLTEPRGPLSRRAWASADIWYRQQLAPHFLEAWEAAGRGEGGR